MHRITKIAATALATAALITTAGVANAATLDSATGIGFVGKGEVQSAFGLNNGAIQKIIDANELAFTFTSTQAASQELTSSVSQIAHQAGTQTAHRVLSCTVTVGGVKNPKVFENDGTREGVKVGTRQGTREGSRAGSLTGTLSASIDAKARKTGQWTGWNLKKFTSGPTFDATGTEVFGDADFPNNGAYEFVGDYVFGDVEWSGWQAAEPGSNPADCLRNDNGAEITELSDVTTYGEPADGDVTEDEATFGGTDYLGVTGTGLPQVFVTYNSATKPLTITVPLA